MVSCFQVAESKKVYLSDFCQVVEFFPRDQRIFALLAGYFDESGTHDSRAKLVVAGFVADKDSWATFEEDWNASLEDQKVPFFKAQWFEKRKEFFRDGWDDRRRKAFMTSLISAIESARLVSMSCSVEMELFNEIVPTGKVRNKLGSAYTLCGQRCMSHAMKTAKSQSVSERIAYWFDAGHKNRYEFQEAYDKEKEDVRDRALLGPLTFADEQRVPGLQAADLLAYELALYQTGKQHRRALRTIVTDPLLHTQWLREMLLDLRKRFVPGAPFVA